MSVQSLGNFYTQNGELTLDNCDREPLHLSGAIQHAGMLIVVHPESGRVVSGSMNVPGIDAAHDPELVDLFPDLVDALKTQPLNRSGHTRHQVLDYTHLHEGQHYTVVFHHLDEHDFFEFIALEMLDPLELRAKLRYLREACGRIINAATFETALQIGAEAVKFITGYARVKIYEFQDDWSGKVVAEDRDEHMRTYMGLHFPDTDIPRQARHLFRLLPYRYIAQATDDTVPLLHPTYPEGHHVDLTWSVLRSVSPMHTMYLRNMEVHATFSSAILEKGQLWGLFVCHNHQQRRMPFDLWGLVKDVGEALMARLEQEKARQHATKIFHIRKIERQIADIIRRREDLNSSLKVIMPQLRTFLDADGFAFVYGDEIFSSGKVPPGDFIKMLVEWTSHNDLLQDQFVTRALHKIWPDAREHVDTACGVLMEPVEVHRLCNFIWFRGPVSETASWAGNPNEKKMTRHEDGSSILNPRASFEIWVSEHNDKSASWSEAEVKASRDVLKAMVDLLASQLTLERMAYDLELFSYAAAHDIKGPLRAIRFALETARYNPDNDSQEVIDHILEKALGSAERLRALLDQLMQFLILGNNENVYEVVDLMAVVNDVRNQVHVLLEETGAKFITEHLPVVNGSTPLLTVLIHNLVVNALKYRHPEQTPEIIINGNTCDETVELMITDNGLGIDQENANKIFEPFFRLHHHSEIKGSGLGLAICKRIAELHEGYINLDTTYTEGTRFKITLRNSLPHNT